MVRKQQSRHEKKGRGDEWRQSKGAGRKRKQAINNLPAGHFEFDLYFWSVVHSNKMLG